MTTLKALHENLGNLMKAGLSASLPVVVATDVAALARGLTKGSVLGVSDSAHLMPMLLPKGSVGEVYGVDIWEDQEYQMFVDEVRSPRQADAEPMLQRADVLVLLTAARIFEPYCDPEEVWLGKATKFACLLDRAATECAVGPEFFEQMTGAKVLGLLPNRLLSQATRSGLVEFLLSGCVAGFTSEQVEQGAYRPAAIEQLDFLCDGTMRAIRSGKLAGLGCGAAS